VFAWIRRDAIIPGKPWNRAGPKCRYLIYVKVAVAGGVPVICAEIVTGICTPSGDPSWEQQWST
jgi:hypothetical protein